MYIIEIAKAMIHDLYLCISLGRSIHTMVNILNRCPHRILMNKTPKKDFTNEKPHVLHFHVFGFPLYIHIHDEKKSKLETSSMKESGI